MTLLLRGDHVGTLRSDGGRRERQFTDPGLPSADCVLFDTFRTHPGVKSGSDS